MDHRVSVALMVTTRLLCVPRADLRCSLCAVQEEAGGGAEPRLRATHHHLRQPEEGLRRAGQVPGEDGRKSALCLCGRGAANQLSLVFSLQLNSCCY